MDRRDFLWTVSAAGVGTAAVATSVQTSPKVSKGPAASGPHSTVVATSVAASGGMGALPFTLVKFAEDRIQVQGQQRAEGRLATLSPLKDIVFAGFAGGLSGSFAGEKLDLAAIHRTADGGLVRHEFWSHRPLKQGGTSQPLIFSAHDDAFVGLDVLHTDAIGRSSLATFKFNRDGIALTPGVWVMAARRASTGISPVLSQFAYSGDLRAPVKGDASNPVDFAYLSFVVHGEWV